MRLARSLTGEICDRRLSWQIFNRFPELESDHRCAFIHRENFLMTYIIATTNMKGGVGKTTLTVNLGASLAKDHGKRVLVVDLDTQISVP